MKDVLLDEALKSHGIPYPANTPTVQKFERWGKNERFWAIKVNNGYLFGDFVEDISASVFPKGAFAKASLASHTSVIDDFHQTQEKLYEQAQKRAQSIWESCPFLTYAHAYLARKKVLNMGFKTAGGGSVVIPLKDVNGTLWTLQFIRADGKKYFLRFGKKADNFFMLGKLSKRVLLCEGYATACSVYLATKECTVACFDAGNLEKVAVSILTKYPETEIIFCADNDRFGQFNTGLEKAKAAAQHLKAKVVYPEFPETDLQSTDFNDLHCWYGLASVRSQLSEAVRENR